MAFKFARPRLRNYLRNCNLHYLQITFSHILKVSLIDGPPSIMDIATNTARSWTSHRQTGKLQSCLLTEASNSQNEKRMDSV